MASDNFARVLALAALDDSELKSLEERVDELARIGFKPLIVEELPTEGMDSHTLYLVPNTGEQENDYDEYLWFEDTGWELMGTTSVDLSDYYTKEETDALLDEKQDNLTAGRNLKIENNVIDTKEDINIYYVDASYQNPFVFSEHEPGRYYLNPGTQGSFYFKAKPDSELQSMAAVIKMDGYLIYHTKLNASDTTSKSIATIYCPWWSGTEIAVSYWYLTFDGATITTRGTKSWSVNAATIDTSQQIWGKKTFTTLPESSVTPTTANQLTNKSYVDTAINAATTQYTTMPEATASTVGKIVQYTGETDPWYTNGYFYIGVENTGDPTTYDWVQLNVQPSPDFNVYMLSAMNNTQQNPVILANCKPGIFVGGTDDHRYLYLKLFEEDPNTYGLDLYYGAQNVFYYTKDLSQYDYATYTGTLEFGYTLLPIVSPSDASKVTDGITRYIYYGRDHTVDSAETKSQLEFVKASGNQTVSGVKTFSSLPESSATPENDNQLVNKLYTDTAVSSAIDDRFFYGTDLEWNELTQEQQDDFLLAVVYPAFVELTPEDQSNLGDIVGSDEPVVSDMTEEDAIAATDEIIGGNNG